MKVNNSSNSGTEYSTNGGIVQIQTILSGGSASIEAKAKGSGLEAGGFSTVADLTSDGWQEIKLPKSCVYRYVITGSAEVCEV